MTTTSSDCRRRPASPPARLILRDGDLLDDHVVACCQKVSPLLQAPCLSSGYISCRHVSPIKQLYFCIRIQLISSSLTKHKFNVCCDVYRLMQCLVTCLILSLPYPLVLPSFSTMAAAW
jgi:hypothetical protein